MRYNNIEGAASIIPPAVSASLSDHHCPECYSYALACGESSACAPLKHHLEECARRVEGGAHEDCIEELYHFLHCVNDCVSSCFGFLFPFFLPLCLSVWRSPGTFGIIVLFMAWIRKIRMTMEVCKKSQRCSSDGIQDIPLDWTHFQWAAAIDRKNQQTDIDASIDSQQPFQQPSVKKQL